MKAPVLCGIAGFCDLSRRTDRLALAAIARRMAGTLAHRGPDGEGVWADQETGLALGQRRLAIIDPSRHGAQPMESASGRYVIVYNGEIYNFPSLKMELEERGVRFRGHCDTEILLAAIERYGLSATLERLVGMFAFTLYDRERRRLHLVRDRLGKKPLYFGRLGDIFVFASELKALRAVSGLPLEIDRGALIEYLRSKTVPAPCSIYRGIYKLLPGCRIELALDRAEMPAGSALVEHVRPYWSAAAMAAAGQAAPLELGDEEAADRLAELLGEAVRCRLVSDVPLGAFLSGGIDSSLVVAQMQANSDMPVRTFTIGFDAAGFDEAAHARAVAAHLGTEHTELYVSDAEARRTVPLLPSMFDEPFADSSQIPTYLVSCLARSEVTVALSGDGGDELFAGYGRYPTARRLAALAARCPAPMRRLLARAGIAGLPALAAAGTAAGISMRSEKLHKYVSAFAAPDADRLYRDLTAQWEAPESVVANGPIPSDTAFALEASAADLACIMHRMMLRDMAGPLADDILTKVDRASMANGLEVRAPILDHRIVEFAWRLPLGHKWRDGKGKRILRNLLARHLPEALFERPKQGFKAPVAGWLRREMRDWAESLLDEDRLRREGFLDPIPVHRRWRQHLAGSADWSHSLWTVLMFEAWKREAMAPPAPLEIAAQ